MRLKCIWELEKTFEKSDAFLYAIELHKRMLSRDFKGYYDLINMSISRYCIDIINRGEQVKVPIDGHIISIDKRYFTDSPPITIDQLHFMNDKDMRHYDMYRTGRDPLYPPIRSNYDEIKADIKEPERKKTEQKLTRESVLALMKDDEYPNLNQKL